MPQSSRPWESAPVRVAAASACWGVTAVGSSVAPFVDRAPASTCRGTGCGCCSTPCHRSPGTRECRGAASREWARNRCQASCWKPGCWRRTPRAAARYPGRRHRPIRNGPPSPARRTTRGFRNTAPARGRRGARGIRALPSRSRTGGCAGAGRCHARCPECRGKPSRWTGTPNGCYSRCECVRRRPQCQSRTRASIWAQMGYSA